MKLPAVLAASLLVQQAACHQYSTPGPTVPSDAAIELAWTEALQNNEEFASYGQQLGSDLNAFEEEPAQRNAPVLYATTEAWASLQPRRADVTDENGLQKRGINGLSSAGKIGLAAGTAGIGIASFATGHYIGKKSGMIAGMKGGRSQMGGGMGMYKRAAVHSSGGPQERSDPKDDDETLLVRGLQMPKLTPKLLGGAAAIGGGGILAGYGTHKVVVAQRNSKAAKSDMNGGSSDMGMPPPMKRDADDDDDSDFVKRMQLPKNFGTLALGSTALAATGFSVGYGGHAVVVKNREKKAAMMSGGGGDMGGGAAMRRRSVTYTPNGPVGAGGYALGFARQRSIGIRDADDEATTLMARGTGTAGLVNFLKSKPGVGVTVGAAGVGTGYVMGRAHGKSKSAAAFSDPAAAAPAGAEMAAPM